ncbi:MAG: bifunctional folylpolyglutamate synthase/dihydrofolate synthase [Desulfuromonadales bacterium]|nr:bifunctional folylpolyglutamate synthase/dihydrofolate synthase [Desulfuromonadales bacterium]
MEEYQEIISHIFSRGRFGIKPGLERISAILRNLGNPEKNINVINIVGTNGKGSTGAFLSSIMTNSGSKTGFFSSPHLSSFTERFRIDNQEPSEGKIGKIAEKVLKKAPPEATFFEIVTAMGFLYFAREKVDIAIMEAGMGGESDATNIAEGILSIITPISIDHSKYLGTTTREIAIEKAGIIKKSKPVVIGPQKHDALLEIKRIAKENGSPCMVWGEDFYAELTPDGITYDAPDLVMKNLNPSLKGRFQVQNLASAITAARILSDKGFIVTDKTIRSGIENSFWPGRMEMFSGARQILLDSAHNPAGTAALIESLPDYRYNHLILIFGAMADKAWQESILQLAPHVDRVITVKPNIERALNPEELADFCNMNNLKAIAAGSVKNGLELAEKTASEDDLILVTGSIFVVGEARSLITGKNFMPIRG